MAESWLYWVAYALQKDGKVALSGKMVQSAQAINSQEVVQDLIDSLTLEIFTEEELEMLGPGELPLVPLTWTLVSAKKGPAVKGNGRKPPPAQ